MAQINLIKTNRTNAVTTVTDKVGVFIDENGILCGIDEGGDILELGNITNGVKRYKALLTQTGISAPTATILENTLGEVPTYNYSSPGAYTLTVVASLFTQNKTVVTIGTNYASSCFPNTYRQSATEIRFWTANYSDTNVDEYLIETLLLIEVYP